MKFQLVYVMYRWIMSLYFISSLIYTSVDARAYGPKVIIYVTQYVFYLLNFQSLWAAIFVTVTYFRVFFCQRIVFQERDTEGPCNHELVIDDRPVGCCGIGNNGTFWYQNVYWVLYSVTIPLTLFAVIGYWGLVYDPVTEPITYANLNKHLINGILVVVDLFVTAIPIRVLHVIYPITYAGIWIIFSGIYYVAGGTDIYGNRYIYKVLNYEMNPASAAGLAILVLLVAIPVLYLCVFGLYLLREGLLYLVKRTCCGFIAGGHTENEEIQMIRTEQETIA